jgi:IS30 family transposase
MRRVQSLPLSSAEKAELWTRWRRGELPADIGRALHRRLLTVLRVVRAEGGKPPAPRRRSHLALTAAEREEISRGLANGGTLRGIGRVLHRAPSTISREVRRHGGRQWYRASVADAGAWERSRRPKRCRLATRPALRAAVAAKLLADGSPEQIAGWLRHACPDDPEMHVSHETIYRSLFVQSRGVLKKILIAHLRRPRTFRRSQRATLKHRGRGQITDAVSIRERPAEVDDRAVPGHWEGDLLTGGRSQIATLVERQSRYVMLIRLESRDTHSVVRALTRRVRRLPQGLMTSLTWDRGPELFAHKRFSIATKVQVYFCDPRSPWQRGSNENTNGLLRQYFPKGMSLAKYDQAALDVIAKRLNTRPRKTLGYHTPADKLAEIVASTG